MIVAAKKTDEMVRPMGVIVAHLRERFGDAVLTAMVREKASPVRQPAVCSVSDAEHKLPRLVVTDT